MRLLAAAIAFLIVAIVTPAGAVNAPNECQGPLHANPCVTIPVNVPNSPVPGKVYYLYLGVVNCGPFDYPCLGWPGGARVAGVLYEESNPLDGLQRDYVNVGGWRPPDTVLLL